MESVTIDVYFSVRFPQIAVRVHRCVAATHDHKRRVQSLKIDNRDIIPNKICVTPIQCGLVIAIPNIEITNLDAFPVCHSIKSNLDAFPVCHAIKSEFFDAPR